MAVCGAGDRRGSSGSPRPLTPSPLEPRQAPSDRGPGVFRAPHARTGSAIGMAAHSSDLVVRRHERYGCDLAARALIAPEHAAAVRPARSVASGDGGIPVRVVDCSMGGFGLASTVFFPMTCRLIVTLTPPGASAPIVATLRVQRTQMSDRKPTYYIGGAFEDASPEALKAVGALLDALRASGAPLVPEKSGG